MEIRSITLVWNNESKEGGWEAGRGELEVSVGFITYVRVLIGYIVDFSGF